MGSVAMAASPIGDLPWASLAALLTVLSVYRRCLFVVGSGAIAVLLTGHLLRAGLAPLHTVLCVGVREAPVWRGVGAFAAWLIERLAPWLALCGYVMRKTAKYCVRL